MTGLIDCQVQNVAKNTQQLEDSSGEIFQTLIESTKPEIKNTKNIIEVQQKSEKSDDEFKSSMVSID